MGLKDQTPLVITAAMSTSYELQFYFVLSVEFFG